ncbi:MAG TPA: hypothetical protein PKD12_02135 [Nitrospira sp.]|nr:hypothetical protein [Nitrospira sp.]
MLTVLGDRLVDKIRVLFANYPMMVPEAIRQLVEEQEDMEVVGDCRGPMKILQETGRTNADAVVLTPEGDEEPGLCSQLLAVYPDLTVLQVARDIRSASVQQLSPVRCSVTSSHDQEIIQALRMAVQDLCNKRILRREHGTSEE